MPNRTIAFGSHRGFDRHAIARRDPGSFGFGSVFRRLRGLTRRDSFCIPQRVRVVDPPGDRSVKDFETVVKVVPTGFRIAGKGKMAITRHVHDDGRILRYERRLFDPSSKL